MTGRDVRPDPGGHTVTVRVPFDVLAPLLLHIAAEVRAGAYQHLRLALDDLDYAHQLTTDEDLRRRWGVPYDTVCGRLDAALQVVDELLPDVLWELPAHVAGTLGGRLAAAADDAGIAGWCARCCQAIPLGQGITDDEQTAGLRWCCSDCVADAREAQVISEAEAP